MVNEKFRYFIELGLETTTPSSRREEQEIRREKALQVVQKLRDWLHEQGLENKVATISPTAFGQVQITCAADVMQKIRDDEEMNIV
ncbi:MAG: hypothetical protein PHX43_08135, partial [Alphaproteobacteria bacterium]|nr:hypothetical protein [Alphaproteobacteria bacterium]